MQYGRQNHAIKKKVQMQHAKKRKKQKKILFFLSLAACSLIVLNLFLFLQMQAKAKKLDVLWDMVNSELTLDDQEIVRPDVTEEEKGEAEEAIGQQAGESVKENGKKSWTTGIVEGSYASQMGLDEVERPRERSKREVLQRLEELGKYDSVIADICENYKAYPDKMLEALANNPEMAEFVNGYSQYSAEASGELTKTERDWDFPLFLQWDPRWGYVEYGDGSCIGLAGCGPTCLSMALYYLTGDGSLTPDEIATYSMENGYYVSGTGTAWGLLTDVPGLYGLSVSEPKASEREFKNAVDDGKVIICSVGAGDFTVGGHFVVIYGYNEEGFFVNDPNCVARSRKRWDFEELEDQIKHVWIIGEDDV